MYTIPLEFFNRIKSQENSEQSYHFIQHVVVTVVVGTIAENRCVAVVGLAVGLVALDLLVAGDDGEVVNEVEDGVDALLVVEVC